jgi:hypothetical protein
MLTREYAVGSNCIIWRIVRYKLSPLIFNFALEYAIRKVQENQVGLKLTGTHQLLVYADNMYLLGDNIRVHTMKKNRNSN